MPVLNSELDPNALADQLVCLTCGKRQISKYNEPCCGLTMVYERAWAKIIEDFPAATPTPVKSHQVSGGKPVELIQLALF